MKRMFKLLKLLSVICILVCLPIYIGCFFGIYYPFLKKFEQSTCQLHSTFPEFYSSHTLDGEPITRYLQLRLYVQINNKKYVGLGCYSDRYDLGTTELDSSLYYSYQYAPCNAWNNSTNYGCKSYQEVQPRWLCEDIKTPIPSLTEEFDCWYSLVNNGVRDIDRVSVFEQYPHQDKPYIEIIFDEEPFYSIGEYYTLQIINLGFLVILPFIYLFFIGIPAKNNFHCYFYCYNKLYGFFRKRICVCWKYYDPLLIVRNRKALFVLAIYSSSRNSIKTHITKRILKYFP